mgnify:CR=1 FL=1
MEEIKEKLENLLELLPRMTGSGEENLCLNPVHKCPAINETLRLRNVILPYIRNQIN